MNRVQRPSRLRLRAALLMLCAGFSAGALAHNPM